MAAAALEAVWDDLVAAISGIRMADGYRTTVHTVTSDPVGLLSDSRLATPAVQILWEAERSRQDSGALGDITDEVLVFAVEWRLDCPGLDDSLRRQALSDWRTDLEHAVLADCSRGGVAWDTEIADGPGPWVDATGILLGTSLITVRVSRARGVA
jgi:hypothetical protein